MLGIADLKHKCYTRLSGGARQLVLIAKALCQEPEIILFDEPTTYLDLKNQIKVMRVIKGLSSNQGVTCVLTLHDPNLALAFCDEVMMFKKGRVVQGEPGAIITASAVEEVYGIKAEVVNYQGTNTLIPDYYDE